MVSRPIHMFDVIITMASTIRFARLTKRPTYEFGVSINMSWVTKCTMLVPRPIIESIVANGVFMLCESIRLVEPIDYRCVTSSLTIGTCTIVVDAWGASTCYSMDVFKVGSSTYYEALLGGACQCLYSHHQIIIIPKC